MAFLDSLYGSVLENHIFLLMCTFLFTNASSFLTQNNPFLTDFCDIVTAICVMECRLALLETKTNFHHFLAMFKNFASSQFPFSFYAIFITKWIFIWRYFDPLPILWTTTIVLRQSGGNVLQDQVRSRWDILFFLKKALKNAKIL